MRGILSWKQNFFLSFPGLGSEPGDLLVIFIYLQRLPTVRHKLKLLSHKVYDHSIYNSRPAHSQMTKKTKYLTCSQLVLNSFINHSQMTKNTQYLTCSQLVLNSFINHSQTTKNSASINRALYAVAKTLARPLLPCFHRFHRISQGCVVRRKFWRQNFFAGKKVKGSDDRVRILRILQRRKSGGRTLFPRNLK
jgi:hypothetical protein